jgi:exosortase
VTGAGAPIPRSARATWLGWAGAAALALIALIPLSHAWRLSTDLAHGWVVPLLMAYLWWERWPERPGCATHARNGGWWAWAILLPLALLPLRLLLTPFPQWPALLAVFVGGMLVIACTAAWLAAGFAGVRWFAPPLVLLLSAVPWPTAFDTHVIQPLRIGIAACAAEVVNLFIQPALAHGTSLQVGGWWVGVDEACGGIRSLQACVMIGLFFGAWYRFSWLRRVALVLGGVGAALLGNFLRVVYLSTKAGEGAEAIASAHDAAGWIAMLSSLALTSLLACAWAGFRWPTITPTARPTVPAAAAFPTAHWLALAALLLLAGEAGTRGWFARGSAQRQTLPQWTVQLPESARGFRYEPLAEVAREMLRPDGFVSATWQIPPDHSAAAYYVEWTRGQIARAVPFLHNPTVCLPLAGCDLVDSFGTLPVTWRGTTIPFHVYKFKRVNSDMAVAFVIWDPSRNRPLEQIKYSSWRAWLGSRWRDVVEAREHQPAQLFTVALDWTPNAPTRLQQLIEQLLTAPHEVPEK